MIMSAPLGKHGFGRIVPRAILGASLGAIASALIAEHLFDLEPCVLCLYQRIPYAVTGVLAALAIFLSARGYSPKGLIIACGFVFLAGSALAFFHVGVQQHWWGSVTVCGGELASGADVTDLAAQLDSAPRKPCDEVDWRLFGLSMAGYNTLLSLAMSLAAVTGGWYLGKGTRL